MLPSGIGIMARRNANVHWRGGGKKGGGGGQSHKAEQNKKLCGAGGRGGTRGRGERGATGPAPAAAPHGSACVEGTGRRQNHDALGRCPRSAPMKGRRRVGGQCVHGAGLCLGLRCAGRGGGGRDSARRRAAQGRSAANGGTQGEEHTRDATRDRTAKLVKTGPKKGVKGGVAANLRWHGEGLGQ